MTEHHSDRIPVTLDIDMDRCFMEVANTESFTKAGNNIGLTQSCVSVKIRRLEERLSIQAAVQTGIGLSILPKGAITKRLRKAPSNWELHELPIYSLALFTNKKKENDARDVFVFYLEAELNNLE